MNAPANVAFHRPANLDEALALLARDADARPIAGGVSLVAIMNARLARPSALVSLRAIELLRGIRVASDGSVVIGAMTRHRDVAADARLTGTLAVVREAALSIANPPVRNMGTIGGSISLADPAADFPPALVAAGATIEIAHERGTRSLAAGEFVTGWYTTALAPGELVTAIRLPAPRQGASCYEKLVRVSGDLCIASVALSVAADGAARAAVGGCGARPVANDEADALLCAGRVREAGELLARTAEPMDDVRGSAEYRRLVIPRMLARAWERTR